LPQRGQRLRDGASSFQADARVLRLFDFDFFFLGTATVGLQLSNDQNVFVQCTNGLRQTIGASAQNEPVT